ncbi:hypothetical protein D3C75_918750 [compost metagenome]
MPRSLRVPLQFLAHRSLGCQRSQSIVQRLRRTGSHTMAAGDAASSLNLLRTGIIHNNKVRRANLFANTANHTSLRINRKNVHRYPLPLCSIFFLSLCYPIPACSIPFLQRRSTFYIFCRCRRCRDHCGRPLAQAYSGQSFPSPPSPDHGKREAPAGRRAASFP